MDKVALGCSNCASKPPFSLAWMHLTRYLVHTKQTCLVEVLHPMSYTLHHIFEKYLVHLEHRLIQALQKSSRKNISKKKNHYKGRAKP